MDEKTVEVVKDDQTVEVVKDDQTEAADSQEVVESQKDTTETEQHEEMVVTIGDKPVEDKETEEERPTPIWVKKVRQQNRELARELREMRKQLAAKPTKDELVVGEKPTLSGHDYDTEKYEAALASWYDRKRQADERIAKAKAEEEEVNKRWTSKLNAYSQAKASFRASDFAEAESVVTDLLNVTQQGIIVSGANDPAMVIYALGKNEGEAKKLAAIKDPVEFAFAVAKLEGQVKVSTRKPSTSPESKIVGNERATGAVDPILERLRTEAEKTGDYTKVSAYKRSKRG
jgi:hypothetical protein